MSDQHGEAKEDHCHRAGDGQSKSSATRRLSQANSGLVQSAISVEANPVQNICFMPTNATALTEMVYLARLVKEFGALKPVMLLSEERLPVGKAECALEGLDWLALPGSPPTAGGTTGHYPGMLAKLNPKLLWRSLCWRLQGPASEFEAQRQRHIAVLQHQMRAMEQVIAELKPAAAILAGERKPWWEIPLIEACRGHGIPTLVAPVAYGATGQSLFLRRVSPLLQAKSFPDLKAKYPKQVKAASPEGGEIFFYEAPLMTALAEFDLLPPDPWAFGGGRADLVMAEGRKAKECYVREGADPAKIVVTGHRAHDELFRDFLRKREAAAENATQGPVVLALPQLAEEGVLDWDHHWKEIRFLCRTLQEVAPGRGLVSLHPKMDSASYHFVEEEFGLTVAKERLSTFLPGARVFLASFSSTLFWATLCQVPAIILDLYGYNYKHFDHMSGAVLVQRREDLGQQLLRLLADEEYHKYLTREQARWAKKLSPFDGHCAARIMELIDAAVAGRLAQTARAMEEAA